MRDMETLRKGTTARRPRQTRRPSATVTQNQCHHRLNRTYPVRLKIRKNTVLAKRELERGFLVFKRRFKIGVSLFSADNAMIDSFQC